MNLHLPYPTLLLAALMLLAAACHKDDHATQWVEVTAEGYNGAKLLVDGQSGTWSDGDELLVNGTTATVHRIDGHSYISASSTNSSGTNRALYPASLYNGTLNGDNATITLPTEYTYRTDGEGRQLLALPMAARAEAGRPMHFRHLTGALYFTIVNNYDTDLDLDWLSVRSDTYRLNGSRSIDFNSLEAVAPISGGDDEQRTVTLLFFDVTLAPGDSLLAMIPIAPVGSGNHFTVEVSSHHEGTRYTYRRTQSSGGTLERNQLGYAKASIENQYVSTGPLFKNDQYSNERYTFPISTTKDFLLMTHAINNGWTFLRGNNTKRYSDQNYSIEADLEMQNIPVETMLSYNGQLFDGKNHTISNLTIKSVVSGNNVFCGLFGQSKDTINIRNLTFECLTLSCSTSNKTLYVAPLICHSSKLFTLNNCRVINATINASTSNKILYCGGLIALNESIDINSFIQSCTVTSACTVSVSDNYAYVGGLIGEDRADNKNTIIQNSNVTNTSVSVSTTDFYIMFGGLVGRVFGNIIRAKDCSWSGNMVVLNSEDKIYAGGLAGRLMSSSTLTAETSTCDGYITTNKYSNKTFGTYIGNKYSGCHFNQNSCTSSITVNGTPITNDVGE